MSSLPETKLVISDATMRVLDDRAKKANPSQTSFTNPEAVKARLADREQRNKASQS